jgi:cellulase/cellobiase CelA1
VTQKIETAWPGAYLATVEIRNARPTAVPAWTLAWTFSGTQRVTSLFRAGSWSQSGRTVTVVGPSWAPLAANGGTASVGFIGEGTPGTLTAVTLNGASCGVPAG